MHVASLLDFTSGFEGHVVMDDRTLERAESTTMHGLISWTLKVEVIHQDSLCVLISTFPSILLAQPLIDRDTMSELPVDTSTLKFSDIHDAKVLTTLLSLLFEPTPALQNLLVPSVLLRLTARSTPPATYNELIDICSAVASDWTWEQKAEFIAGHPIIGAPKVGGLSGKEQGAGPSTPRVVLDR